MFTPHTPRPLFIAVLATLLLVRAHIGIGQNVKLFPLTEYENSLRQYHTAKIQAQCVEFAAKTRTKWWYYLPNIGVQFGLPSVNAGTNQLVQIDQTRQQNKVKLASIKSQGLLDYRTELHQLRSMYTVMQIERDTQTELETSWRTIHSIYQIAEEAHTKKEIKPSEYYQSLLTYQQAFSATEARRIAYELKVVELSKFARYGFPTETLPEIDSLYVDRTRVKQVSRR